MMNRSGGGARKMRGLAVGLVSNISDPDKLGRVKVKFPWLADDLESNWARVAGWYAGGSRGTMFVPEVGDEVMCAFDNGDPNHPYVVGAVWNGKHKPHQPANADGANDHKWFKSRQGHDLEFLDTDGGEQIRLVDSAKKHSIVLDTAADTITAEAKSGSIKLSAPAGTISVECTTFKSSSAQSRAVSVGGSHSVSVGGSQSVGVSSGSMLETAGGGYSMTASSVSASSQEHAGMSSGSSTVNAGEFKASVGKQMMIEQPAAVTRTIGKQVIEAECFVTVKPDGGPTGALTLTAGKLDFKSDKGVGLRGQTVTLMAGMVDVQGSTMVIAKDQTGADAALASFLGGLLMLNAGGVTFPAAKMLDMVLGMDIHPHLPPPPATVPVPIPAMFAGPIVLNTQPTVLVNFMPSAGAGATALGFHPFPPLMWAPVPGGILRAALMALIGGAAQAAAGLAVAAIAGVAGAPAAAAHPNGFWSGFLSQPAASAGGDTPMWQRLMPAFGSPMSFISFLAQCLPLPMATAQTTIASPSVLAADSPMGMAMPMGGNSCSMIPIVPNANVLGFSNVLVGMSVSQLLGVIAWNFVSGGVSELTKKGVEASGQSAARQMAVSENPAVRNRAQGVFEFSDGNGSVYEGHPVDVATGTLFSEQTDFALYSAQVLEFGRFYNARDRIALKGDASVFGPGWRHTLDEVLVADVDAQGRRSLGLRVVSGGLVGFDQPTTDGASDDNPPARLRLTRLDGRTYSVTALDGTTRVFKFPGGAPGDTVPADFVPGVGSLARLVAVRSPWGGAGVRLRYEHERLSGLTDAAEREVTFDYDAEGRLTEARLVRAGGKGCSVFLAGWRYDAHGCLVAHEDRNRRTRTFVYDSRLRMVRETDRNGHAFHFDYDAQDRCVRTHGDDNVYYRAFVYEEGAGVTRVDRGDGGEWLYGYDATRRITSIISPLGAATRQTYSPEGWLATVLDPLGRVTEYGYDAEGRRTRTQTPSGVSSQTRYDDRGFRVEHIDPAGKRWPLVCDAHDRLIERRAPSGRVERYTYDAAGRVASKTAADGRTWTRAWSAEGLPLRDTRPDGSALEYAYDLLGHVTVYRQVARDGSAREVKLARDAEGRIQRVERPLGFVEHYTTLPDGEVSELRVGGRTTRRVWGAYARLDEHVDPAGRRTVFKYDLEQRVVAVELESGARWRYTRDAEGRVVEAQRPDGARTRYERDAAGQVVAEHLPDGRVVRRTYDAEGRVVEEQLDGEPPTRFAYDAFGRLISAQRAGARPVERAYDADGHLVSEQQGDERLLWDYDAAGRRSRRRASWGESTHLRWGASGLTHLRDNDGQDHDVLRDAWGRRAALRLPGGAARTHAWDDLDRQIADAWLTPSGAPAHARALRWSDDDRIAGIESDGRVGRHGEALEYDAAGRLTTWSRDTQAREAYDRPASDAVGLSGGTPTQFGPGGRPTTDTRGRGRKYDARGRMRRIEHPHGPARQLWFDGRDRLVRVVTEDARLVLHEYDALGRLARTLAETSGGLREERLYWDANHLARRVVGVPGAAAPERDERYVYDPERGVPLWRTVRRGGEAQVQHYACDQRGAATHLFDAAGDLVWEGLYAPYGAVQERGPEAGEQPLRLAGQVHDVATGLSHHRYRVYDPETASFVSPDPLGFPGGQNPWAFPSDPMRLADPLGLSGCLVSSATSGEAYANARETAGIPDGQQPDLAWTVGNDHTRRGEDGYVFNSDPTTHGNYEQFETPNGSRVIVESTTDPTAPLPSYTAGHPEGDATRRGIDFGWSGDAQGEGSEGFVPMTPTDGQGPQHYYRGR